MPRVKIHIASAGTVIEVEMESQDEGFDYLAAKAIMISEKLAAGAETLEKFNA